LAIQRPALARAAAANIEGLGVPEHRLAGTIELALVHRVAPITSPASARAIADVIANGCAKLTDTAG
jgi:hypothetical protein